MQFFFKCLVLLLIMNYIHTYIVFFLIVYHIKEKKLMCRSHQPSMQYITLQLYEVILNLFKLAFFFICFSKFYKLAKCWSQSFDIVRLWLALLLYSLHVLFFSLIFSLYYEEFLLLMKWHCSFSVLDLNVFIK